MKYLNPQKMLHFKERKFSTPENHRNNELLPLKKKFLGQHFLRNSIIVDRMIDKVIIPPNTTVVEIGCGDGFLTEAILKQTQCKQLIVFEIDPDWSEFVKNKIKDTRLKINLVDILSVDLENELLHQKPLVLLANLPYQITFPILFKLQKSKSLFAQGVVMVQEEVAQKIVAQRGKKYSPTSMFLQYHFDWQLLDKVDPGSFTPPPKVFSRTIFFKPKEDLINIPNENEFWEFVKICFKCPRQTIRNNLKTTHYFKNEKISLEILKLRAQQLSFEQFLNLWKSLI